MNFRQLMCFRAVVEFGTISKASAHLRIAQPALSRQIQKLEHDLGVQLLNRTTRGVTPTNSGRLLLERTTHLDDELADIRRDVIGTAREATGVLRIALQAPLSTVVAPEILSAYAAAYPKVRLRIFEGYSAEMTDGLLTDKFDLAIMDTPSHSHADLTVSLLWTERLRLIGRATAEPSGEVVALAEVARLPLILTSPRYVIRRLIDEAFAAEQIKLTPVIEADGPAMILAMVRRGLGHTLMPMFGAARSIAKRFDVAETSPAIQRPISIVTRTAVDRDEKVAGFVRLLRPAAARFAAREGLDAPPP